MKRVLITGANSFLGDNTKSYLEKNGDYQVDILNMLDDEWRRCDFSNYDVVFNVCAIVHRPDLKDESLYYKINRDLAIEIAKKAKFSHVKQFIQTSTNGVFGIELGEMGAYSKYHPKTPYEKSKLEADNLLEKLRDDHFKICIVRPPIIYGSGGKGNYPVLEKFALTHNWFPSRKNKRDMIFIGNICDFIKFAIDSELNEICYPRDQECVCVAEMIKTIAELNNRKMKLVSLFNPLISVFYRLFHKTRSVFGNNYCSIPICSKEWYPPYNLKQALSLMYKTRII